MLRVCFCERNDHLEVRFKAHVTELPVIERQCLEVMKQHRCSRANLNFVENKALKTLESGSFLYGPLRSDRVKVPLSCFALFNLETVIAISWRYIFSRVPHSVVYGNNGVRLSKCFSRSYADQCCFTAVHIKKEFIPNCDASVRSNGKIMPCKVFDFANYDDIIGQIAYIYKDRDCVPVGILQPPLRNDCNHLFVFSSFGERLDVNKYGAGNLVLAIDKQGDLFALGLLIGCLLDQQKKQCWRKNTIYIGRPQRKTKWGPSMLRQ